MPLCTQKEEIEQEAQEKIEDTKHDIDEAAHNPVSSLACYCIMLYVCLLSARGRCIYQKAACFQTGLSQDACLDETMCTCGRVFLPLYM